MLKLEEKQPLFTHPPQTSQCSSPHQSSLRTMGMSKVPTMFPVLGCQLELLAWWLHCNSVASGAGIGCLTRMLCWMPLEAPQQ